MLNLGLKKNGICVKGIVYSREGVGSKGKIETKYEFEWNNNKYFGVSTDDDKYYANENAFVLEEDLIQDDTLIVVFKAINPTINRSNTLIGKQCFCN